MNQLKKYKLAILISHPIQYHVPLFRALSAHPRIELTVYYCWDFGIGKEGQDIESGARYQWDIPLLDGYAYKFLNNISPQPSSAGFFGQINPGIMSELWRNKYDALWVHGYSFCTDWLAFFVAFFLGIPIFFRGISHLLDSKPWYVNIVKRAILTSLFAICRACLYIGTHNREYYKAYGVPDRKLFHVPHIVDNAFFSAFSASLSPKRAVIRKRFGFSDDRPVVLFLGRLVSKKRPQWVLDAYQEMRKRYQCGLLVAGEGPARHDMEKQISLENIPDVVFTGFLNQTEIPRAYIAADIFILPSAREETWGLVVNEAMNFGLPIIVSDKVGCAPDLVYENQNGFVISSFPELREALSRLIIDKKSRCVFGSTSKEIISAWNVDRAVEGAITALQSLHD